MAKVPDLPLHHTSTPFFEFFRYPPLREVIEIQSPFKKRGGPNYGNGVITQLPNKTIVSGLMNRNPGAKENRIPIRAR